MGNYKTLHFTVIVFLLFTSLVFGQNYSKEHFKKDYDKLIASLMTEDWNRSEEISKNILHHIEGDHAYAHEQKVLRYIYLYSTAGLLNNGKLTKDEAYSKVKNLKGKEMIMPAHPFISNCYVNCTHFAEEEKHTFFSGVNNMEGTQILSFEYVEIKDGIKESQEELEGRFIILSGTLNEISVAGNLMPRFRLKFINGRYEIADN